MNLPDDFNLSTNYSLREKCPNTEYFLLRIFLYSDGIQENTDQKKTPYLDTFHAVIVTDFLVFLVLFAWRNPSEMFFLIYKSSRMFYKLFLKILQKPHINTCARVSSLVNLQARANGFCEIFKNAFL